MRKKIVLMCYLLEWRLYTESLYNTPTPYNNLDKKTSKKDLVWKVLRSGMLLLFSRYLTCLDRCGQAVSDGGMGLRSTRPIIMRKLVAGRIRWLFSSKSPPSTNVPPTNTLGTSTISRTAHEGYNKTDCCFLSNVWTWIYTLNYNVSTFK